MRLVLLVSGDLGMRLLIDINQSTNRIMGVFTDKRSKFISDYCKKNDLKCFVGNPRKGKATSFIEQLQCDVLLSINYLFIIEEDLIQLPKKYAINFHGSLLPKYRGRTPHIWAIINGESETGITAHILNEKLDDGDIVHQVNIPIGIEETGADILNKFHEAYPTMVKVVLMKIENDAIIRKKQDRKKAVYFSKRTPNDGQINWNWSRVRIRNWIRAQAKPYPGAFSFLGSKKIVINKAIFSDFGFSDQQKNGTVLEIFDKSIIVKTPTGALEIKELNLDLNVKLSKGDILK